MLTEHSSIVSKSSSLFAEEILISTLLQSEDCEESLPLFMTKSSSLSLIGMSYMYSLLILYIFMGGRADSLEVSSQDMSSST